MVALRLLSSLRLPQAGTAHGSPARPLREILAQPALRVSVFGAAVGYAVMIMVMTATPLAILGCGLNLAVVPLLLAALIATTGIGSRVRQAAPALP